MRRTIILAAFLFVHRLAWADSEVMPRAAAKEEARAYSPISAEPFRPTFTLSADSDGVIAGKLGLGYSWDQVGAIKPDTGDAPVSSFTLGPTVGLSYNGKKGLFSIGTDKKGVVTQNYGESAFNIGFLFAYSRLSIATPREFGYMEPWRAAKNVAVNTCKSLCSGSVEMENRDFCEAFAGGVTNPEDYDYSEFCPDGKVAFKRELAKLNDREMNESREEQLLAIRVNRYRFPVMDLSLWGGGGAAKFDYYDMTADSNMTPSQYTSLSDWKASGGIAAQFTWVPVTMRKVGFTLEIPIVWKQGY